MPEINKIKGITVGQFGDTIQLQVVDKNGQAVDISAYTGTKTVTLRDTFTLKTLSYTATFVTDGTDGEFQFTPTAATEIDRAGKWEGQLKLLIGSSAAAYTVVFEVDVERKIG